MSIFEAGKNLGMVHNVSFRIIDTISGATVQEHIGHNSATNTLLTGIGHYLIGEGVLNQGYSMLSTYIPRYISLGTMGLMDQGSDESGLPTGIGVVSYDNMTYAQLTDYQREWLSQSSEPISNINQQISSIHKEMLRFSDYLEQCPGYGADGYDVNLNNGRQHLGLGPTYGTVSLDNVAITTNCELISDSFPRAKISFRDVVPETESEQAQTVDVIFSAMISTGALRQFRGSNPYIFITEAGLWATDKVYDSGYNGLLAGYRISPPNRDNWDMRIAENRDILKRNILCVGINQVVQVIWKIQLGSIDQLMGLDVVQPGSASIM